jgi:hypothetical protein
MLGLESNSIRVEFDCQIVSKSTEDARRTEDRLALGFHRKIPLAYGFE